MISTGLKDTLLLLLLSQSSHAASTEFKDGEGGDGIATPSADVTIAAACRVRDLQQLLLLRGFFTIFCLLQMEIRFVKKNSIHCTPAPTTTHDLHIYLHKIIHENFQLQKHAI
jgi:hypothetical protein